MIGGLLLLLQLANPTLTPGVVRPLSKSVICATKWGRDVRHVTPAMKRTVFARYGIPWSERGKFEIDHYVSRELGGADAIENLFPEPWTLDVGGFEMGARRKDRAETATHRAVCRGQISLQAAQRQIAQDWTQLYRRFVGEFPRVGPR